ncbi:MAG TPA: HAD-IA family hydrolase [Candidatus Limnocylindrales bacterium]|nr:HAD-IA family hydrolase [Candidatus Limnocylindrales bacterium]
MNGPLERPQVVFFDLGDTLVRAHPSWADVYLGVCRAFGVAVEREALARALEEAFREHGLQHRESPFPASEEASYELAKAYDEHAFARLGLHDLPDAFYRAVAAAFVRREAWHVFPDVPPALDVLATAGIRLGLISNWTWQAPALLHELGLAQHFEVIIISARVGFQKPDRGIFEAALTAAGVTAGAALHVGDSWRNDILGAKAVGMRPVLIDRHGGDAGEALAEGVPVVRDLAELLTLLGLPSAERTAAGA